MKSADLPIIIALILLPGCFGVGFHPRPASNLEGIELVGEIRQFRQPRGIDVGPDGRIYVVDAGSDLLAVISPSSRKIESLGGSGWRVGEFNRPMDVAHNPLTPSQVYLLDSGNDRVQKGDLIEGRFSIVGSQTLSLSSPRGLDVDTMGNLYVADTGNHRVIRFNPMTGNLMELLVGQLREPLDVSVGQRSIYILDGSTLFVCDRLGNMTASLKLPPDGEYSSVCAWRSGAMVADRNGRLILTDDRRIQILIDRTLRGIYGLAVFRDILYATYDDGRIKILRLMVKNDDK